MRRFCRARSTTTPRGVLAGGLVLAVLGLVGCAGGASTAAFTSSYERVTADYRSAMQQAQAAARAAEPGQSPVLVYEQLRGATSAALEDYAELAAPEDTAEEFAELTRGLQSQVEALDRVLQAAENDDAGAARAALADYATALGAWQSASLRVEAALSIGPARAGP